MVKVVLEILDIEIIEAGREHGQNRVRVQASGSRSDLTCSSIQYQIP